MDEVNIKDDQKRSIEIFLPKPEDPESVATVLPSFLLRREQIRSSTIDMEFYFPLLPQNRTFKEPRIKITDS